MIYPGSWPQKHNWDPNRGTLKALLDFALLPWRLFLEGEVGLVIAHLVLVGTWKLDFFSVL